MRFSDGPIDGVSIVKLKRHEDSRGYLMELFRSDEVDPDILPVMSYLSMTKPGVVRGPHEHMEQTDYFCFAGPSDFRVYLWDNRADSPTYMKRMTVVGGSDNPLAVVVPVNVVHAYKNIGDQDGVVINCPNRLYAGKGKAEKVDEVRYEDDVDSPFEVD